MGIVELSIITVVFAIGMFLGYEMGWRKAYSDMTEAQAQETNSRLWTEMMGNLIERKKDDEDN